MCIEKIEKLLIAGETNEKIAKEINLSKSGVKWHINKLFRRYKAKNRIDLAVKIALSKVLNEVL